MRTRGSWRVIEHLRLVKDLLPEIRTETVRSVQVHCSTEELRQLVMHGDECKSRRITRLEFNENIDIAFRHKIIAQHRAEKGEFTDMVAPAELGNFILRDFDSYTHRFNLANIRVFTSACC